MLIARTRMPLVCLPRDFESVFAIDEFAGSVHAEFAGFVEDTLSTYGRIDGSLDFPNVLVFGRHLGLVESGMKDSDGNVAGTDFLRQQDRHHVGSRLGHVMAVIVTGGVLGGAPINGPTLGRNDDNLGILHQIPVLEKCRRHPQRTQRTNINRLELLVEIQRIQRLERLVKVSRVVNQLYQQKKNTNQQHHPTTTTKHMQREREREKHTLLNREGGGGLILNTCRKK